MKFNGDFDIVSQDLEGFKLHFKTSLVTKYQSFNLQESQITDINVYRGSVVVQITLEDPDDDEHGTSSNTANVTLVLIHLEQDVSHTHCYILSSIVCLALSLNTVNSVVGYSFAPHNDWSIHLHIIYISCTCHVLHNFFCLIFVCFIDSGFFIERNVINQ